VNTDTTASGAETEDIYIAKYDPSGTPIWATSVGGTKADYCNCIAISKDSNVYICGNLTSPSITVGSSVITNPYGSAPSIPTPPTYGMIAKFSAINGSHLWAQRAGGGTRGSAATDLVADKLGNIYMEGTFKDTTVSFGTYSLTRPYLGSAPFNSYFLMKFTPDDTVAWGRAIGSATSQVHGYGIDVSSCAVWVSCRYYSPANISGTIVPFPYTTCCPGFIASYDLSGTPLSYADFLFGSGAGASMACNKDNDVFVNGSYSGPVVFGPDTLKVAYFLGEQHLYVTKYVSRAPCCSFSATMPGFTYSDNPVVNFTYSGPTDYDSLRWHFGDGSTSTTESPSHIYLDSGTYIACVYIYYGCDPDYSKSYCDTIVVPMSVTGLPDRQQDWQVTLFPNPVSNKLTINTGNASYRSFKITNVLGQTCLSGQISGTCTIVNVHDLPAGIYQVTLQGNVKNKVIKLVKQ
jgi:hypothetical protein